MFLGPTNSVEQGVLMSAFMSTWTKSRDGLLASSVGVHRISSWEQQSLGTRRGDSDIPIVNVWAKKAWNN